MNKLIYTLIIFTLSLQSCDDIFDYSPYQIDFEETNINVKNISKIVSFTNIEYLDTLKIAFTGDTHRFYDEWVSFVDTVNKIDDIDFAIHVGDFTDYGLPIQYEWGYDIMSKLNVPFLVVVGNHDLVANGPESYNSMFGKFDFSFIYAKTKFIFLNTNSREFAFDGNVPNLDWYEKQLVPDSTFVNAIIIAHVSPVDADFDPNLRDQFREITHKYNNIIAFIHGHTHHFEEYIPEDYNINFINVYGAQYKKATIVKFTLNEYKIENISF
ncbi:MAG: metallophosphoesterase [Bacteroidales bacterium]|jgi:predicted phosphodiesterase|nr:metallophosphoesterase [Bacteroidales bacterium]